MQKQTYEKLRQLHPCFGKETGKTGRIHLPVSPCCNLACRYCSRTLTESEERPGTARGILPVEKVPEILEKALELCPGLTTVGIAGPGEALASPHAIQAFTQVEKDFPQMVKCLSTNGLLLPEKAQELAAVHVDAVTVTVNSVDPAVQMRINKGIRYHDAWIEGEEAAAILIRNQTDGIRRASNLGITVKVNIVLIPGINDSEIETTAKTAADAGAKICNIIPLIPQADMAGLRAPSCSEVESARKKALSHLDVFYHCRHCRADAAGILGGEDIGKLLYESRYLDAETFSHG
ncbi:MAG: radical SAM protein [Eubacterium sp.]|nr:radical SAM protein [Eubacterium sp.]